MLLQILTHTPTFIWVVLAGLVALGLQQSRDRRVSLARVTVLPLALFVLSLVGVISAFGAQLAPLLAWSVGAAAAIGLGRGVVAPRGASWSATRRQLHVRGSFVPLALIVGLFAIKYVAGVTLAMQPTLATDRTFDAAFGLAYGAFAGLFLTRAAALWQLTRAPVAAASKAGRSVGAEVVASP